MKTYFSILFYTVLFVSFVPLSSCQNSLTDVPQTDQYFPNSVGDRWTYAVSDSSGRVVDTLQVTVQQKTTLTDGTQANLWQYLTSDSSYSRYVTQQADSVFFYADSTAEEVKGKIVVPYKVGNTWNLFSYSYNIDKSDSFKLKMNEKFKTFHTNVISPVQYGNPIIEELWLKPYIGVVKTKKYVFRTTTTSHVYSLLDYSLK